MSKAVNHRHRYYVEAYREQTRDYEARWLYLGSFRTRGGSRRYARDTEDATGRLVRVVDSLG